MLGHFQTDWEDVVRPLYGLAPVVHKNESKLELFLGHSPTKRSNILLQFSFQRSAS